MSSEEAAALKQELDGVERAMVDLLVQGKIDPPTHAKMLLGVACEHARSGRLGDAHRLVTSFGKDYYDGDFALQCAESEEFCNRSYELALAFVAGGMADLSRKFLFDRPPALA